MENGPNKRHRTGAGGMSKFDEEDTLAEEETDSQELDQVQNLMRDLTMDIPDELWNHSIEYLDFNQQLTGAPDTRWSSNRAFKVIVLARPFNGPLPQNMYNTFWEAMLVYKKFRERWPYRLFTIRLQMAYGPIIDRVRASSQDYAYTFRQAVAILAMSDENVNFLRFLTSKVEIIVQNGDMSVIYAPRVIETVQSQFRLVKNLTSVNVPNTLQTIQLNTFQHCSSLKSFTFPSALTRIKKYAFQASGLVSVDLSTTKLTIIEEYVFSSCASLTSVTFPDSLQTIQRSAFQHCTLLASVVFPPALHTIRDHAFASCMSLTSLYFKNSLRLIEAHAFSESGIVSVILSIDTDQQYQAFPKDTVVTFYDDFGSDSVNDESEPKTGRNDSSAGGGAWGAASQFCQLRF
jgi:uncharacterized membrane protein